MKKVFALMVVSLFLAGLAFSTETRIDGLGVQTWQTLDDDAIVFDYVGQLSNFKNIAVVEQTSPSTGLGGVILGLDGMSLGAFVGKKSIMLGEALTGTDDMFPITIPVPLASVNSKNINNVAEELLAMPVIPINLLYSIDMSDMSIGFGLGYASSGTSWEEKTPDTAKDKYSANAREISALLGLTMGSIDAGLKLAIPSVSIALDDQVYVGGASQASRDNKWDVSGMAVNLLGRINLGEALLANLAIGYVSGSGKLAIKADGNNDGKFDNAADTNKESSGEGSNISVELGVSKEIKAQTAKAICAVVLG